MSSNTKQLTLGGGPVIQDSYVDPEPGECDCVWPSGVVRVDVKVREERFTTHRKVIEVCEDCGKRVN